MRHDVTFPLFVEVDEIYNLACPASPIHYQYDPVQTTKTSRPRRDQHARACQASGRQDPAGIDQRGLRRSRGPSADRRLLGQREPDRHPRSCYDEGKRCAETLFFDYHRQHGVEIKVARIFNTYGPRMHPATTAASSPTSSCRRSNGEPITIYGDGRQTRSFCYVDDLIDGLISPDGHRSGRHRPDQYRQSRTSSRSSSSPKQVIELTGSKSQIVEKPLPADDPKQRQPDITKARDVLQWAPRVPLNHGLEKTINYFRELLAERIVAHTEARPLAIG